MNPISFFKNIKLRFSAKGSLGPILLGRAFVLFLLFGSTLLYQLSHIGWKLSSPLLIPVWFLMFLSFGIGAISTFISKKIKNDKSFVASLIFVDALTITALIYMTGTNESYFQFLYLTLITFATLVFSRRGGILTAILSSLCYSTLMLIDPLASDGLIINLLLNNCAFFVVGMLVGYIAEELKLTGLRLGESEKAKRGVEEFSKIVVSNISVGLLTVTKSGRIVSLNPAGESILELSSKKISQYLIEDRLPDFESLIKTFEQSGRAKNLPFAIRYKPERMVEEKFLDCAVSVMKNGEGEEEGYIIIFNDKTELQKMEEHLQLADKQAAIGQAVAGIAHEIRNPLASISGSMEFLKQSSHLKPEEERLVEISLREVDHLNNLISELLEYSRPEKKQMEVYHINELIKETLKELELHKEYKPFIHVKQEMPALVVPMFGDRGKIKQVFWNLFLNACQAMHGEGTLSISVRDTSNAIEVVIEDTGEGIPAECISKIFDPFFTTKDQGTGLGLAMVYKIIESHSGSINVSSQVGGGTKFKIYLPKPHVGRRHVNFLKEQVS